MRGRFQTLLIDHRVPRIGGGAARVAVIARRIEVACGCAFPSPAGFGVKNLGFAFPHHRAFDRRSCGKRLRRNPFD